MKKEIYINKQLRPRFITVKRYKGGMSLEQDKQAWAEECKKAGIPADFIKWFEDMTEKEFYVILGTVKMVIDKNHQNQTSPM